MRAIEVNLKNKFIGFRQVRGCAVSRMACSAGFNRKSTRRNDEHGDREKTFALFISSWLIFRMKTHLKDQFQRKLQFTGCSDNVADCARRCQLRKPRIRKGEDLRAIVGVGRQIEVGPVEKIERLNAELKLQLLSQREALVQRKIDGFGIRPFDDVPTGGTAETDCGRRKSVQVVPTVRSVWTRVGVADQIGPSRILVRAVTIRVTIDQRRKRHSRSELHDGVDLPSAKRRPGETFHTVPKWQIVGEVRSEIMTHVKIR